MPVIHQSVDEPVPAACQGGAITIGNFDGVHRGHQALVAETIRRAGELAGPAVALTLDPHPQKLLRPDSFQPELTTLEERAQRLESLGLDQVVVLRISPAFLRWTARGFFNAIVCKEFRAKAVIEGFNFGFGKGREGNAGLLKEFGQEAGVAVTLLPPVECEGQAISTSRIRRQLLAGSVAAAAAMLGRPYRLRGTVCEGRKRGQSLGFPTANLAGIATLIPGDGVYAVRVHYGNKSWPAAANVGPNPTFGESARKVEVHLIGFQGDLYGQFLTIDFVERIRDTRRFAGPGELVEQLKKDIAAAQLAGS